MIQWNRGRWILGALVALTCAGGAQGQSVTDVTKPDMSVEELETRLKPFTLEQLEEISSAWVALVQESGAAVADAVVGGDANAQETAEAERDQRGARLTAVLDSIDAKGGDTATLRAYLAGAGVAATTDELAPAIDEPLVAVQWAKDWITSPDGGVKLAINIAKFLVVLLIFRFISRILGNIVGRAVGRMKQVSSLLRDFFVNTVSKLTMFVGFVIGLSFLGVDIGPFLAAMGAAGFVIGFALQGTLSNFASGVMILLYRPYDLGDVVNAGGVTGKVEAMTLVSTTLLTPDNQVIVVPNSSIWGSVITNVTARDTRRVDLVFGCGYDDDLAKAQAILEEVAAAHPKALADPAPTVKVHELADSSVNFIVRPWSKTSDYWEVYWDLTRTVKERFDAAGLNIPFPQTDVHVHGLPVKE